MLSVDAAVPYGYDPVLFNDPAILEDLLATQDFYAPEPFYCPAVQTAMEFHMRDTVVNWLIDVCRETSFMEGVANTVQLLDRYLSKNVAQPHELQLLAAACLFITNKIKAVESISPCSIVGFTDNSITVQELLLVELLVAKTLDWDLVGVTVYDVTFSLVRYLQRDLFLSEAEAGVLLSHAETHLLAFLRDHESLQHPVSHLAAAAVHLLAWQVLGRPQHELHAMERHLRHLLRVKPSCSAWQRAVDYARRCLARFLSDQQEVDKQQAAAAAAGSLSSAG